jgi:hypothetical protein
LALHAIRATNRATFCKIHFELGMSEALDVVKKLTALAEKLLHETERLRRDVANLNARVQPIEGRGDNSQIDEYPPPRRLKWLFQTPST